MPSLCPRMNQLSDCNEFVQSALPASTWSCNSHKMLRNSACNKFWHNYSYVFIFFFLQVSLETLEKTHRVIESFIMQTAKWALAYICKNWKLLFVKIGSIWQSEIWLWNAIKSVMQSVKKCGRLKFSLVDIHLQISARKGT